MGHVQEDINVPSRDYDVLLVEGSSTGLINLVPSFTNLSSSVSDCTQKVLLEGVENASHQSLMSETLKVHVGPLSIKPVQAPVLAQPSQKMPSRLAQFLSQAKLFTSGVAGMTRSSSPSCMSPFLSDQLHQALALLRSCFTAGPSAILMNPIVNSSFVNSINMLLQHLGYLSIDQRASLRLALSSQTEPREQL